MFELHEPALKICPDLYDTEGEEKITFYDHCKGSTKPFKCTVYGKVVLECDLYLVVAWWDTHSDDLQERESNSEFLSILKAVIIDRRKL